MAAPKYLARSWWADSGWPRGGAALVDTDLWREGNVIHYPGRASTFGRLSLVSLRNNLRGWWSYHVNTRGWADIGYQTAIAMTEDGPVVVDLRGIGRVPAAHASASNPRANWHGGATLWLIGNTETPHLDMIEAYRHYRHMVWLKRWPTATKITHHRRVPGTSTLCAGDRVNTLVLGGTLVHQPSGSINTGGDDVIGLKRGDKGEPVKGLQATLGYAGFPVTVDGTYGTATSAAVLKMRKSQGSTATNGDSITGYAYGQLLKALARRYSGAKGDKGDPGPRGPEGPRGPAGPASTVPGPPGKTPTKVAISGDVIEVE